MAYDIDLLGNGGESAARRTTGRWIGLCSWLATFSLFVYVSGLIVLGIRTQSLDATLMAEEVLLNQREEEVAAALSQRLDGVAARADRILWAPLISAFGRALPHNQVLHSIHYNRRNDVFDIEVRGWASFEDREAVLDALLAEPAVLRHFDTIGPGKSVEGARYRFSLVSGDMR